MDDSVTVRFIRHEKTKANLEKRYIGWTDESIEFKEKIQPLSIQAKKDYDFRNSFFTLMPQTLSVLPKVVYGSDLKRCRETAQLYFQDAVYVPYADFRELHFGDFELKTYDELKNHSLYRKWIDNPYAVTPPNGESFFHFKKRVVDCFHQIVQTCGEYVFVLHGGVIRLLLSEFGNEQKPFKEIDVMHRTIYTLQWEHLSGLRGGERCKQLSVVPIMENENMSKDF